MTDHARYEEWTALAAGGLLSDDELAQLREHLSACPDCRKDAAELRDLFRRGLPLTPGFSDRLKAMSDQPDPGAFGRFLARAGSEGLRLSRGDDRPIRTPRFRLGYITAFAGALAALVLVAIFYLPTLSRHPATVEQGRRDTATFAAQLAARDQELASLQKQLRDVNVQLSNALKTAETYRRESQQKGVQLGQSSSQRVQLQDELQDGEKQLQAANEGIARINQLRATDKTSLEAQRLRIREISDQLRIADATLEMERQLSAAGNDIRQLLVARQLHVVDVRDVDENGKPSRSFGRVFLTEGKSLMFFAFDLNDPKAMSTKARFEVWGEQLGKKGSVRALGVLSVDDTSQNRWALNVENPGLLSDVDFVYVTVPSGRGESSGRKMLKAFLGEPTHG